MSRALRLDLFSRARVDGLDGATSRLDRFRFPAGVELPTHEHPEAMLVVQLHGGFSGTVRGRGYELGAGGVAWLPAAARHSERVGPYPSEAILVQLPESEGPPAQGARVCASGLSRRLARQLEREIQRPDAASVWIADALVERLLGLFRESTRSSRRSDTGWLDDAVGILQSIGLERQLGLNELAIYMGVDRCHLARRLRQRLGTPPGAFLRRRRLERAGELLRETDDPIARIAHECGFYDHSHFCNLFRRAHGSTPSDYRAAYR